MQRKQEKIMERVAAWPEEFIGKETAPSVSYIDVNLTKDPLPLSEKLV